MFNFEKIFAALLVAGVTAMLSGFVADKAIHPHALEKDAIAIAGDPITTSGPSKPTGPEPILALLAEANIDRGQKLSKACAACHSFTSDGPHKVGPNLWNIVNAQMAAKDGFSYSSALTEKGEAWDYDALNAFMWKPKAYVKGTKMNFAGLKKTTDRAALIAWLRTLSTTPEALPSAADIEASMPEQDTQAETDTH